jgi:amino acid permease
VQGTVLECLVLDSLCLVLVSDEDDVVHAFLPTCCAVCCVFGWLVVVACHVIDC